MPRDLSRVIARLSKQKVPVTSQTAGQYVDGRWVASGSTSVRLVLGSIQPLSADEIQNLDVGQRERASFTFWTREELRTENEPDRCDYDGAVYEFVNAKNWRAAGNFKAYVMLRVEGSPNG